MPKAKKTTKTTTVKVSKPESNDSFVDKMQNDLQNNQSYLNIILGGLIIIILGVLVFNWFNKTDGTIGPSQDSTQAENTDVSKDALPGTYTVKAGDTLFTIAEQYYNDGYKYSEIVKENKLANENTVEIGQKLVIPKIESEMTMSSDSPTPTMSPETSPAMSPSPTPVMTNIPTMNNTMTDQNTWGEKITGDSYTIKTGDSLASIAARAYGDVNAYDKIAKANKISNPDSIEIGMVLKLPR